MYINVTIIRVRISFCSCILSQIIKISGRSRNSFLLGRSRNTFTKEKSKKLTKVTITFAYNIGPSVKNISNVKDCFRKYMSDQKDVNIVCISDFSLVNMSF